MNKLAKSYTVSLDIKNCSSKQYETPSKTGKNKMIISISQAAKKFNVSRSKIYRMKENGQISFTKNTDDQVGIDVSEMLRVFGECKVNQPDNASKDNAEHDLKTENYYLKREIEALSQNLQKSESRVDQLLSSNQEQTKQLFLSQAKPEKSFWRFWWKT